MKKSHTKPPLSSQLAYYSKQAKSLRFTKTVPASGLLVGGAFLSALPVVECQIMYTNIPDITLVQQGAAGMVQRRSLDINQDGINDFEIVVFKTNDYGGGLDRFEDFIGGGILNGIVGRVLNNYNYPNVLNAGDVISNANIGQLANPKATLGVASVGGPYWDNAPLPHNNKYFGFRFQLNGNNHYGWIQLNYTSIGHLSILDFAYEQTPNRGIIAGETMTSLPVELSSFQAISQKESIRLHWSTETEKDNAGFELQRSDDGQAFQTLQFLAGAGSTTEKQEYSFDDKTVRKAQAYFYRLKQIDNSGSFQYSDIVRAALASEKLVLEQISPNPVVLNSAVQLRMRLPQAAEVTVTVFDMRGIAVHTEQHELAEGLQTLPVQVVGLPAGAYFVKATANGEASYQKLLIGR